MSTRFSYQRVFQPSDAVEVRREDYVAFVDCKVVSLSPATDKIQIDLRADTPGATSLIWVPTRRLVKLSTDGVPPPPSPTDFPEPTEEDALVEVKMKSFNDRLLTHIYRRVLPPLSSQQDAVWLHVGTTTQYTWDHLQRRSQSITRLRRED